MCSYSAYNSAFWWTYYGRTRPAPPEEWRNHLTTSSSISEWTKYSVSHWKMCPFLSRKFTLRKFARFLGNVFFPLYQLKRKIISQTPIFGFHVYIFQGVREIKTCPAFSFKHKRRHFLSKALTVCTTAMGQWIRCFNSHVYLYGWSTNPPPGHVPPPPPEIAGLIKGNQWVLISP